MHHNYRLMTVLNFSGKQGDFVCVNRLGTLSIDDEMGRRRRPEVKFSRANLLGMREVVKTSSSLRRRRNSGRFAVVAKT